MIWYMDLLSLRKSFACTNVIDSYRLLLISFYNIWTLSPLQTLCVSEKICNEFLELCGVGM